MIKQPDSSGDYRKAVDIIDSIKIGQNIGCEVGNIKRFRKYLYELGYRREIEFATRKTNDYYISITRIS